MIFLTRTTSERSPSPKNLNVWLCFQIFKNENPNTIWECICKKKCSQYLNVWVMFDNQCFIFVNFSSFIICLCQVRRPNEYHFIDYEYKLIKMHVVMSPHPTIFHPTWKKKLLRGIETLKMYTSKYFSIFTWYTPSVKKY